MGAPQREESLELSNSSAQRERIRRIAERGPTGRLRHCLTVGAEIHGQVDENELRGRLGCLIDRRPALGSVFTDCGTHRLAGGSPVFRRQAISAPDAASRWRITRDIAAFEAQRPFAPGEHPLVRGLLLSPEVDRHLLVLTIDQLVGDSWSANLIVRDLFGEESARSVREPDGYAAVWREREEWLADPEGVSAVERRRRHLADATPRWPIPANPDLEALSVAEEFVALNDSVTDALRVRVREAHGSLLAVAAMALVLSIVEDPDQPLALLSTLAGRETPAEQEVVGWFAGDGVIRLPASPRHGPGIRDGSAHRDLRRTRRSARAIRAAQRRASGRASGGTDLRACLPAPGTQWRPAWPSSGSGPRPSAVPLSRSARRARTSTSS